MSWRIGTTRAFLWVSVLGLGIGLGGKLFDILVVARAWGLDPPASLACYPYGRHFPMNPGDFFQPLSAIIAIGILGALICGWKTPVSYRLLLLIPFVLFAIIWIVTPTIFWPIIVDIYHAASPASRISHDDLLALVHRWFVYDWMRTALIAGAWISSIRAISLPFPLLQR